MLPVPSLPVSLSLALILLLFLSRRTAGRERELLTLGELVGKLFLPWYAVLRCVPYCRCRLKTDLSEVLPSEDRSEFLTKTGSAEALPSKDRPE